MLLEKKIQITAAFDKRHSYANKKYGIHGAELRFLLIGDQGAVQFVIYTNWHLPHVEKEMEQRKQHLRPLPADLGYHSPTPRYDGETCMNESCEYLGGKPCYHDGSGLAAVEVFDAMISGGDAAMWKYLEDYYNEVFNEYK